MHEGTSDMRLEWFPASESCHEFFRDALLNGGDFSEAFAKVWGKSKATLSMLLPADGKGQNFSCSTGGVWSRAIDKDPLQYLLDELVNARTATGNRICLIEDFLASPGDPLLARYPFARIRRGQVFHAFALSEVGTSDASRAVQSVPGLPPGFGWVLDLGEKPIEHLQHASAEGLASLMAQCVLAFVPAFDDETYLMASSFERP